VPRIDDASYSSAGVDAATEDEELLLLALLDRLQSDYAAGRHPDLAAYCAANPGLQDAFLSLALAMDPPEQEEEPPSEADSGGHGRALSPGVLRALASIPELAGDANDQPTGKRPDRQVAEEPGKYDLESRATRTSKGDS
jgi:hypothetical protein